MAVGPSPFETEFQNILPESSDNVHLRTAKLELRMLGVEAGGGGGGGPITAAQLIPFQGIVFDAPLGYTPENVANKSNDGTMAANSVTLYPSQQAAKTYSDTKLALTGGILSGDLDISTGVHLDTDGSASFGVGKLLISTAGDLSFSGTTHAGLVLNNLTTAQRNAIGAPTEGMLILNTDTDVPNFYNGVSWVSLGTGAGDALTANPLSQFAATTSAQFAGVISDETGTGLVVLNTNPTLAGITVTGEQVFSGTTIAGLRLNNLTTAERDAIAVPTAGMLIWNTTTTAVNQYTGAAWATVGGGSSPPFVDTTAIVMGSADATKLLRFEVDGFTTATTRVLTPQNASYTLAGLETAQTFTAKQTITPPADTTALQVTGFSLTGATTAPMFDLAGTWNTSGVTTALQLNITNTASGADSKLLDLQLGGTSFLSLSKTAVLRLGDGTAPAADPTAAIQQWSAGGEWQYRAATASEGAGQTNRVHNRGFVVEGAGTNYALTTTDAHVVFGTTSLDLVLPGPGTYKLYAVLCYTAGAVSLDATYTYFYNSTDSVALSSGTSSFVVASSRANMILLDIVTVTASTTIHVYGVNISAARGEIVSSYSHAGFIRLF